MLWIVVKNLDVSPRKFAKKAGFKNTCLNATHMLYMVDAVGRFIGPRLYSLEIIMKKLSMIAVAGAFALTTAAPVAAQSAVESDPFVTTQGFELGLAIAGGLAAVIAIVIATDT